MNCLGVFKKKIRDRDNETRWKKGKEVIKFSNLQVLFPYLRDCTHSLAIFDILYLPTSKNCNRKNETLW